MIDNKFINKRKTEIGLIFTIISILGLGFLLDLGFLINIDIFKYIPKILIVKSENIGDILSGVFSAQVSVSTLGIALISILGGILKENVFGVSISQYLMNDKPIIFKHKINIGIELILIVCSYITFSLELYNISVSIFIVSIIIILIMVWDIFPVFYGSEYMRFDIKEYYISVFSSKRLQKRNKRETLINNLKIDTQLAAENSDSVVYKNNFNLIEEVLEVIFKYEDINDREKILTTYENSLSDIFNKMFKSKDVESIIIAIENMENIYRKCNDFNKYSNKKVYLNIFDKVSRQITKAIAILSSENYEEFLNVLSLVFYLYENLNIKTIDGTIKPINHIYLAGYSSRIYYELLNKGLKNYDKKMLFDIKRNIYKSLDDLINFSCFSDEDKEVKISQVYNQLEVYTKTLIDNNEVEILDKTFFKKLEFHYYYRNELNYKYIIMMIIYMYYLVEFEELASDDLKNKVKYLIQMKSDTISYFLKFLCDIKWEKIFIEKIKYNLDMWEIFIGDEGKWSTTNFAVEKFILYYELSKNTDKYRLTLKIEELLKDEEFKVYNYIVKSDVILEQYTSFNKLLFNEIIEKRDAEQKINILKDVIISLYKKSEIKKAKQNKKSDKDYEAMEKEIKEIALNELSQKLSIFKNNKGLSNTIKQEWKLISHPTSVMVLNENYIKKIIPLQLNRYVIWKITNLVDDKLLKLDLMYDDEDIVTKLFEIKKNLEFDLDVLIGYNSSFYNQNKVDEFRVFEKNKFKIKDDMFNNQIVSINSEKLYIKLIDINVEIKDIDFSKYSKDIPKNNIGEYLYDISNAINIPFSEEEMREYLFNYMKCICIKVNIEYGIDEGNVGVGVFIKS